MTQPAVSIIINARNGAAFVGEALESVLAQTWGDWELVFWDDQSTDGTADVFRYYEDKRFRYFYAPRRSNLGCTRHAAVEQARGEWLAILDQDDIWAPHKLETQMAMLERPGSDQVGLMYARAMELHERGRQRVHDHVHEYTLLPEGEIFVPLIRDSCFIAMSTVIVRRAAYDAVGGFPRDYDYAVDYHLYLALARQFRAWAVQEPCCAYRIHKTSLTWTRGAEVHAEVLRILDDWGRYAEPDLLRRRRRVHETLLGVEEILAGRLTGGTGRILARGSLPYLMSRPFVRGWRAARRRLHRSPWHQPLQRR